MQGEIQNLTCSCCHALTTGRQWHNQDDGFGLCDKCADWIATREMPEYVKRTYGAIGIHYKVSGEPVGAPSKQFSDTPQSGVCQ